MDDSRTFAFAGAAGAAFDRAAHLRGRPEEIARLAASPAARVLPLWRGKLLLQDEGLGWLPLGAPQLPEGAPLLFLGLAGTEARFAQDISIWEPEIGAAEDPALPGVDPASDWRFGELRGVMAGLSPAEGEMAATARALFSWHRSHGFCAVCGTRSEPAQAGWQRVCPSCKSPHFPRTDPVVIMIVARGNQVLLGRSPGWAEGMYSCLAGFIEPGETIEAAVRREVAEETGVRVGAVRYMASQPWPFPSSLMIGCLAEAESAEITLDPVELEDAFWISREDLAGVFAGTDPKIRPPRPGAIAGWLLGMWLADRTD